MENSKKVIGVAQVLQQLKDGMTREEIAAHYDITMGECKILFKHKDLVGRKTIKKPSFTIVDDADNTPAPKMEPVAGNGVDIVDNDTVADATDDVIVGTTIPTDDVVADDTPAMDVFGSTTTDEDEEEEVETEKAKATWD
jgi:hypothetical protein